MHWKVHHWALWLFVRLFVSTRCSQSTPSSSGSRGVRRMLMKLISTSCWWISSVRGLSWRFTSLRELMAFSQLTLTSGTHAESRNQLAQFNQLMLTSGTHAESRHQPEHFNQLMLTTETCRESISQLTPFNQFKLSSKTCGGSKILVTWPGHMTALLFFTIFSLNTTMTAYKCSSFTHDTFFILIFFRSFFHWWRLMVAWDWCGCGILTTTIFEACSQWPMWDILNTHNTSCMSGRVSLKPWD